MAYDELLADRIRQYFQQERHLVEEKKMMGGLCFMFNDKMCVGVVKNELMARINPDISSELLKKDGCRPMDFTGRPMHGFVFVAPSALYSDEALDFWLQTAIEYNPGAKSSKRR